MLKLIGFEFLENIYSSTKGELTLTDLYKKDIASWTTLNIYAKKFIEHGLIIFEVQGRKRFLRLTNKGTDVYNELKDIRALIISVIKESL